MAARGAGRGPDNSGQRQDSEGLQVSEHGSGAEDSQVGEDPEDDLNWSNLRSGRRRPSGSRLNRGGRGRGRGSHRGRRPRGASSSGSRRRVPRSGDGVLLDPDVSDNNNQEDGGGENIPQNSEGDRSHQSRDDSSARRQARGQSFGSGRPRGSRAGRVSRNAESLQNQFENANVDSGNEDIFGDDENQNQENQDANNANSGAAGASQQSSNPGNMGSNQSGTRSTGDSRNRRTPITMEALSAMLDQKLDNQSRTLTTNICETNFTYTETCVTRLHESMTRQLHGVQMTMHNHLLMSMRGVQPPAPRPLTSVNPLTAADFRRPDLPGTSNRTQEERDLAEAERLSRIEQARTESEQARLNRDGPTHTSFLSGARNLPLQPTGATVQQPSVSVVPQTTATNATSVAPPLTGANAEPIGSGNGNGFRAGNGNGLADNASHVSGNPLASSTQHDVIIHVGNSPLDQTRAINLRNAQMYGHHMATGIAEQSREIQLVEYPIPTPQIPQRFDKQKAPKFDGKLPLNFLDDFGSYTTPFQSNPRIIIEQILPTCMEGDAKEWWKDEKSKWSTLAQWEEAFQLRWVDPILLEELKSQTLTVEQHPTQCVLKFLTQKSLNLKKFYPSYSEPMRVQLMISKLSPYYKEKLQPVAHSSYEGLQAECIRIKQLYASTKVYNPPDVASASCNELAVFHSRKSSQSKHGSASSKTGEKSEKHRHSRSDRSSRSERPRHHSRDKSHKRVHFQVKSSGIKYTGDSKSGNKSSYSSKDEKKQPSSSKEHKKSSSFKPKDKEERTCHNCGQPGHFANTCTKDKRKQVHGVHAVDDEEQPQQDDKSQSDQESDSDRNEGSDSEEELSVSEGDEIYNIADGLVVEYNKATKSGCLVSCDTTSGN